MAAYRNQTGRSSLAPIVIVGGTVLAGLVLALALGSGQQGEDRSGAEAVHNRVLEDLRQNDIQALYGELSPAVQELFPLEEFLVGEQRVAATQGAVISVQPLEPITLKTGTEWKGEWADARVRIIRHNATGTYIVRYHLENGEWWLIGTIDVQ